MPAVRLEHLSEAEIRAYVIADNKLAELAGWDLEILGEELQFLNEVDIDPTITGFATPEIDVLIDGLDAKPSSEPESAPEPDPDISAVTERGDLWTLGDSRLMCGDATDAEDVQALMAGAAARMAFADPPYNVPINGHVSGKGAVRHREFAMASGELDENRFTAFLEQSVRNLAAVTEGGGLLYLCIDWRPTCGNYSSRRAVPVSQPSTYASGPRRTVGWDLCTAPNTS